MLTIILQSCAAGACAAVSGILVLGLIKLIPNKRNRSAEELAEAATSKFHADMRISHNAMEARLLRSAIAQEKSALALIRLADQNEKNGK